MLYIKDKVKHISDVIYKGTCNCKEEYYGVTDRIAEIRWREHEKPNKDSNPSKHLINNTHPCIYLGNCPKSTTSFCT